VGGRTYDLLRVSHPLIDESFFSTATLSFNYP
jgi:hypothetical protein